MSHWHALGLTLTGLSSIGLRTDIAALHDFFNTYSYDAENRIKQVNSGAAAGYLGFIPKDITGRSDTWQVEFSDELISPEQPGPAAA